MIYRAFFARFDVLKSVLMKPLMCDFTPGKYRVLFARFDVSQSSADEAAGLRFYAWDLRATLKGSTDYGLDGPGSNPGGDEIFRPSRSALGPHPASCKMSTGSFPGVKCGRGVLLTTHPLLVPRPWKSRAIPLPSIWATPDL